MPPIENSISGKTSVCSIPRVEASRSAAVPGRAAAWPANAVMPPSRCRSAKSSTLISDRDRIVPQMNIVGPSMAIAPSTAIWPRAAVSPLTARLLGDDAGRDQRAEHAGGGQHGLHEVAVLAGHERLDEHADERDPEDDQDRRQQAVLDAGLGEVGCEVHLEVSSWAPA